MVITGINITSAPDIIEDVTIQGYKIQTTGCFGLVTDEYLPKASNVYLGFNFWSLVLKKLYLLYKPSEIERINLFYGDWSDVIDVAR